MRFAPTVLIAALPACTSGPLAERLDEPDVPIPADCVSGTTEFDLEGTVVDYVTGEPVAGANVDITEAFTGPQIFPTNGCRIGHAVTNAQGAFGPIRVRAVASGPIVAFLVTGADRAPTVHDKSIGCLLGCSAPPQTITAPTQELVEIWRHELYAGGMEYALNRGLVAYKFHDTAGMPAEGVTPIYRRDVFDDNTRTLRAGSEVRFVEADRQTLGDVTQTRTLGFGTALIGAPWNTKGYYRIGGERAGERWATLGVMSATGWLYTESDSPEATP